METHSPAWSEEIRTLYLSGAANQFLLHGNTNDRLLLPDPDGNGPKSTKVGNLIDFLVDHQLAKFDIVVSFKLGAGLAVRRGWESFGKVAPEFPNPDAFEKRVEVEFSTSLRNPAQAIGFLHKFLQRLVRLEGAGLAPDKGLNVAFIIEDTNLILPDSRNSLNYSLNSMASVVRSWSTETDFLAQNLAVFLVAENLNDIHSLLSSNPRAARIDVALPDKHSLHGALGFFAKQYPKALEHFLNNTDLPADRLAGASLGSIESLLKKQEFAGEPLVEDDLAKLKKELVERDAQGLIEFIEPERTLDDVFGQPEVKEWMRQDIKLWHQGDLGAMPMGYLLCGPVGTGKTYMVECLAGEAGVPVVKFKNFRDKWVGSTEGNLEKIFTLLHALGRCIVFIDEADQALGSRDSGSGDSGISGRVYSMMAKEMSDSRNRGRILWILASSRPDLIEVDLKRPGRVDVKIPLFPAHEAAEAYALIRALCKKHKLVLPKTMPPEIEPLIPKQLTPGAAESLAIKIYRQVKTAGLEATAALQDCLQDYQNPVPTETMNFQIKLAVDEASDLDFVPPIFREIADY